MYHKVIVLAFTVCLANAALVVNVYDNGQESLSSEESCDYQACDQLCRRLGFPGGACVGDRCKCDNFKQSQDLESTNRVEVVGTCEDSFCNTLCQGLGFADGICVNDQCTCEGKELKSQELLSSEASCDYRACDQLCRRLGFPGGACVGDRCKCDNVKQTQDMQPENLPLEQSLRSPDEENEIPQKGGVITDQDVSPSEEKPEINLRSSVLRGSCDCNPRNCDLYCFHIYYTGGICVTGQCRCYK